MNDYQMYRVGMWVITAAVIVPMTVITLIPLIAGMFTKNTTERSAE